MLTSLWDDYEIISAKDVYIGNIDSDDYETADFEIYVDSDASGDVKIPVHYEYMDSNNNKYYVDDNLILRLFTEEETEKYGNGQANSKALYVIGAIVVVVLLFIGWRILRRKKR